MLVTGTGLIPYPNCRILFGSLMEMVKASFPCVLFSNKIIFSQKKKEKKKKERKIVIFINQKTEFMVSYRCRWKWLRLAFLVFCFLIKLFFHKKKKKKKIVIFINQATEFLVSSD
jgi:hypothetical protein